ncbi:hypothetical protein [Pseudescherichia sp.]|uniref:hypothetical protein n=1 Tax=Pseudescherichia sp. TaxID=2055881 RepID=UPI00289CBEEC|nr:hypothetical protein [Pseudescherichia sp.]
MKIVTVLRSGGEYTAEHVRWFDKQLCSRYEHICLTDMKVKGLRSLALKTDWPGWFAKLELFDPELIDDDIFYIDLDTVIVGDFDHMLQNNALSALRDFFFPNLAASGIMRIPHAAKAAIWQKIKPLSSRDLAGYKGDGEMLRTMVDFNFLQDAYPDEIISYKAHIATRRMVGFSPVFSQGNGRVPAKAKIICFHGKPRPWRLSLPWIANLSSLTPCL